MSKNKNADPRVVTDVIKDVEPPKPQAKPEPKPNTMVRAYDTVSGRILPVPVPYRYVQQFPNLKITPSNR